MVRIGWEEERKREGEVGGLKGGRKEREGWRKVSMGFERKEKGREREKEVGGLNDGRKRENERRKEGRKRGMA